MPTIKRHQTFADFATQHGGSLEAWFATCFNAGISLTDDPVPGTNLAVQVVDQKIANRFVRDEIEIVFLDDDTPSIVPVSGIGYMQIGNDFKVS